MGGEVRKIISPGVTMFRLLCGSQTQSGLASSTTMIVSGWFQTALKIFEWINAVTGFNLILFFKRKSKAIA